uniref:Apple domain-containing protein n=1 Tax=Ascaris lumbricoides TaxID=6252 RepID=A0A0M3IH35_ASCLU
MDDALMPTTFVGFDNRMIIFALAYLLFINISRACGFVCVEPNVTTYLRTEGYTLQQQSANNISVVTLHECALLCTESAECGSFQYDSSKLQCALSNTAGMPPDAASFLAKAHDSVLFQKICIETSSLCPSPYAFERYPRHLLVGSALEVRISSYIFLEKQQTLRTTLHMICCRSQLARSIAED